MVERERRRNELDETVRDYVHVSSGWQTARSIAASIGAPWRAVARALMRLAERQEVEANQIEWVSHKCRTRRCMSYRSGAQIKARFPSWLMPMPGQRIWEGE